MKVRRKVTTRYGFYEKTVTVEYDGFLKHCPYGKCGYEKDIDGIILISYNSPIFKLKHDGSVVFYDIPPNFSRTTIKHVGAFCKEFCPEYSYFDIKNMYYDFMEKPYPRNCK